MKKANKPWQTVDGEEISVQDIVETLELAQSLIAKELSYNSQIKKNNKAKTVYGRYKEILGIMKAKYLLAVKGKIK